MMRYLVRIILSLILEGVEALVRGILGLFLFGLSAMVIASCYNHEPPKKPWHVAFILSTAACLYIALACTRRKTRRFIQKKVRPRPDHAPSWIQDGLFAGRYAACVPWSQGEKIVAKAMVLICGALFIFCLIAGAVIEAHPAKRPAWSYSALGYLWAVCNCAYGAAIIMGAWHFLHLRLSPLRKKPGFEPLMARPAPVRQVLEAENLPHA